MNALLFFAAGAIVGARTYLRWADRQSLENEGLSPEREDSLMRLPGSSTVEGEATRFSEL